MKTTETDWKSFLDEGKNYFNKAKRWAETGKFDNDVIYNLVLMSIEKNIMAICLKNNYLPENHTITDLIDAINRIMPLDKELEIQLLEIEKYQSICTINDYNRATEQIKDIDLVINLGNKINDLTKNI